MFHFSCIQLHTQVVKAFEFSFVIHIIYTYTWWKNWRKVVSMGSQDDKKQDYNHYTYIRILLKEREWKATLEISLASQYG